ncbi:TetR/AcrR family transcriptional regulator [Actinoalloteichus hymeniacidonis]|uniref:Transcriptional regulator, TetR family n=1 Tax=Actinoalloteichus hymeniacidonis TaxID=340345 RepID=A0AAC9MZ26_9PSEU|nr:TetR/AcrR family transcriptional regulator [Actinoalloteichus hymeniacidonis]AOS64993.1 transcriptional regulator, TetR family [Actinoalloteichus hymeniacidonis]MBB5906931.1 AcrR family transcriptional regulator [Actinoalloteichus hymeniacidonis]
MPRPLIPHRSAVILDNAEQLIIARGFDRTTVADISERSGIGKGAVYREFPSKEAVLDALLARSMGRLVDEVQARVEETTQAVGLAAIYRIAFHAMRGEPLVLALLHGDTDVLGGYVRERSDDRYERRLAWVIEYIGELQQAGVVRAELPADAVAIALSSLTIGLLSIGPLTGGLGDRQLEAALDVVVELVERGLDQQADDDGASARTAQLRLLDRVRGQLPTATEGTT